MASTSTSQKNVTNKTLICNLTWHKLCSRARKANHIQPVRSLSDTIRFWDRSDLDTSFFTLKKVHVNLKSNYLPKQARPLQTRMTTVLLDFQSFTETPVFECAFAHPMILFLSYVVKNRMDRVSVIDKIAMKWSVMRMCAS